MYNTNVFICMQYGGDDSFDLCFNPDRYILLDAAI